MQKKKLVLIAGPTGVGKTAVSVELAKKMNTEIISCDSMQVYKGMDIGTAKVTTEEAAGIVHHMTDIIEPDEVFSVCDYVKAASAVIDDMSERGMIPLIVGGTGLYADSLIKGIDFDSEAPADDKYRREMEEIAEQKGALYIHSILESVDKESADSIHPNNVKRVIRALEYYHATGMKISDYNKKTKEIESPYDSVRLYLTRDRENLYKRIDQRVDIMLADGLEEEVRILWRKGLGGKTSLQALGYKEFIEYFEGRCTFDTAVEMIKQQSRRYAKRQLTWFSRDSEGVWINMDEFFTPDDAAEKCYSIVKERLGI